LLFSATQMLSTFDHEKSRIVNPGPRALRPLLRVAGIGPEPDSSKDAWDRIERFFASHLH
jgi:hypothetical protein